MATYMTLGIAVMKLLFIFGDKEEMPNAKLHFSSWLLAVGLVLLLAYRNDLALVLVLS